LPLGVGAHQLCRRSAASGDPDHPKRTEESRVRRQILLAILSVFVLGRPVLAQIPSHFEDVELARSRDCVPVLARLDDLNQQLAPLAEQSQRLLAIAQAIAIEDRTVVDSLHASDPLEKQIRNWFAHDEDLAQQYLAHPGQGLIDQRTAAKDSIKGTVSHALDSLQARADTIVDATGDLRTKAGSCSGAIFVRPAVLQACQTSGPSPVCAAARDTTTKNGPFRFVDSADMLWEVQDFRAWSAPGPLEVDDSGQLGGARTAGLTRTGNIVVSVTFRPLLRRRDEMSAAEAKSARILTDSLGFGASHPDYIFLPALAIEASLPVALGDETRYLFHFGDPQDPDIVWSAKANTGSNVQGVVALGPGQLARLEAGDALNLTAVRDTAGATGKSGPVFSIELTSLNQAKAVSSLLGYMAQQFPSDLVQILPPDSTSDKSK
jgi:hypothetical protein